MSEASQPALSDKHVDKEKKETTGTSWGAPDDI